MFRIIETEDYEKMIDLNDFQMNSINETSNETNITNNKYESNSNSSDHKTYDFRSYFQTLETNKPTNSQTITREVEKNSEIMNKKPTFLMTKSRCTLKLNNSSKISNSLLLKPISVEKHKELEKSKRVSDYLNGSQVQSWPQKMRLWIPKSRINSVYKLVSISPSNRIQLKLESEEPESDLICDEQYFRYLGLIHSNKSSSLPINWPLRTVSCLKSLPKRNSDGDIILSDICPKPSHSMPEMNSSLKINENQCEVSRRKLAKHQWLEEVRDNTQKLLEQKQIEKQKDENDRKRAKQLREWKKDAFNLISSFDISSVLGKRIFQSLFEKLNDLEKYLLIIKCENYCLNNLFKFWNQSSVNVNNSSNIISRITRNSDGMEWNPRNYQHKYCFNRMQRLEKWQRMKTGLDWRSRLLKSHCKRFYIKMKKVINCPLCSKTIDSNHQCFDWEKNMSEDSNDSEVICLEKSQSNDEIVIIEDNFSNNELKNKDELCSNKGSDESFSNSDMNCSQEDDDVIFIEEVIQQKNNVLKPKQKSIENKPVISCDLTQNISFLKTRPLQTSNDLNIDSETEHSLIQKNKVESKDFIN